MAKQTSSFIKIREFLDCRRKYQLDIRAPLGYYAAYSGNSLLTFSGQAIGPTFTCQQIQEEP